MNAAPAKTLIDEVALELGVEPAFIEKDWYVVQLIGLLISTDLFGAKLIFTGGTALAKAHRLLQRFSEDIDFRLILSKDVSLTRTGKRRLLSKIREHLQAVLTTHFPPNTVQWKARDENHFFSFDIEYPSVFAPSAVLRPHIQMELITGGVPTYDEALTKVKAIIDHLL
jgi:hypothetical protein